MGWQKHLKLPEGQNQLLESDRVKTAIDINAVLLIQD